MLSQFGKKLYWQCYNLYSRLKFAILSRGFILYGTMIILEVCNLIHLWYSIINIIIINYKQCNVVSSNSGSSINWGTFVVECIHDCLSQVWDLVIFVSLGWDVGKLSHQLERFSTCLTFSFACFSGTRKVRVIETYKGIPVFGSSVTVELRKDGEPTGAAGGHVLKGLKQEVSISTIQWQCLTFIY